MSEAAAKHKVYVIVNLQERAECTNSTKDCPARGYFLYNTNVAFDRKGTVIARYVKHIFVIHFRAMSEQMNQSIDK